MHCVIDFVHLTHEIDSFKLPKTTIDARANRMLFLELIVFMPWAVSNEFTNRLSVL